MKSAELLSKLIIHLYNDDGYTDKEIAEKAGCTKAFINHIRHGRRSIGDSSLNLIVSMFPDLDSVIAEACQAKLEGRPVHIQQANGNVSSSITQTIGPDPSAAMSRYRQKIADGVLSLEISAEAKVSFLTLLKQLDDSSSDS